jgi:hypothetical protein
MRPLSFLFAALLGVVLSLMAPALAGPRPEAALPEAALPEAASLAWATELVSPEAQAAEEVVSDDTLAAVPVEADATLSVEEISRSLLDTINALSDAA